MPPDPTEIARYLACPDEAAPLAQGSSGLRCVRCSRVFPFRKPNLLEILPSKQVALSTSEVPSEYESAYTQAYSGAWESSDDALPFGANETSSPKIMKRREHHTEEVFRLLREAGGDGNGAFCDLSAGAGHTTFVAARYSPLVFHCDLSVAAVRYASAKAARMGLDNMMIVHADYFRPPFQNSIQQLTCLDSLIRGPWHEAQLLASIRQSLAPGGTAVVDFHNWWHNPLRRLGLLRQNFGENRSYSRREVLQLLKQAGFGEFAMSGFIQEADPQRLSARVLRRVLPATRLMVRLTSSAR
jgi:SAM-dependent methyltransferase